MSKSLVAFDTDRIKEYVFATGKLQEIRGASAVLDRLNRAEMPQLVGATADGLIYANGGAGLFVVESDEAEDAIRRVQQAYRRATHTASITGVSAPLPDPDGSDVSSELELVRHRLRMAKDGRTAPILPLTHPLLRFCDACGTRYAETTDDGERICISCLTKRQESDQVKADIERWVSGQAQPDPASLYLWERLIARLVEVGYPVAGGGRPRDFETLGRQSSPKNYMGLIYADGDGMGREIEQIKSLTEMSRFANAVDGAVYEAVTEAISTYLQPGGSNVWPFDILLLGGDDLVMVTRAQSAIDVARHVVERFSEITQNAWGKRLNLSASVVLTHVNYPIGALLGLAESGLKFAKKGAAKRHQAGETLDGGMLNFLVVSSANHLDFDDYYKQELKLEEDAGRTVLYRTQRPYTAPEMAALLTQVRDVRDKVPHTKLEQLRAAIFQSRKQGTIDAMMAVLRLRDDKQRRALLEIVSTDPREQIYLPWVKQDADWATPVLDIVELLDFCGKEEVP
ncbi:MAG: Cas10/Cmr2 second palm domain-containing protein [Anaerolineae bacterium]